MNDLDTQSKARIDLPLHNDVANRTQSTTEFRTTPADTTRKHRNAIGTAVRP
jgi:hypothetical protein